MTFVTGQITLEVLDLCMYFPVKFGLMQRKAGMIKAVDGVNFFIRKNESFALVGESGCGKSTLVRCVLGIYKPTSGRILFEGQEITGPDKNMKEIRRKMGFVFQDPFSSLNPRQTAKSIVADPIRIHRLSKNKKEMDERVTELFEMVGLDPSMADRFPHEFSGGQRQRIAIARALATSPSFIVLDEPVSALDVSIQAQILKLLMELKEKQGLTYLFVSHDLAVVQYISDRVGVMYMGKIVEIATATDIFANPLHPYTQALLSAVPSPDPKHERKKKIVFLKGEPPNPMDPPSGCIFHTRCPEVRAECKKQAPMPQWVNSNHMVSCFLYI